MDSFHHRRIRLTQVLRTISTNALSLAALSPAVPFISTLLVMLGTLLVPLFLPYVAADDSVKSTASRHGSVEHLQESLVESGDQLRLLQTARRQLEIGNRDFAFEALMEIFARPSDTFAPDSVSGSFSSTYQQALRELQLSTYDSRAAWIRTAEPLAELALKQADGDPDKLLSVARRYPLTQVALKVMKARTLLAVSRGQYALASALRAEVRSMFGPNSFDEFDQNMSPELPDRFSALQSRMANSSVADSPEHLALPWPTSLWSWKESTWSVPAAGVFGGLELPENRIAFSLNSWQPVMADESIILRTPIQVLAFDKLSGQIKWSIKTDTFETDLRLELIPDRKVLPPSTSLAELMQFENTGTVAVSDQHVFFVDHFRKYADVHPVTSQGNQIQRQLRLQQLLSESKDSEDSDGRRLVAIRLHPKPEIAWMVGDCPPFDYEFPNGQRSSTSAEGSEFNEVGSPQIQSRFRGQNFCGVPLVHDQMLFVLSADKEVVRLNCLSEATGRLIWQKILTYHNDPNSASRGQIIVTVDQVRNASLCGVDNQTILCTLNNGIIIGTRITDGQFQWATSVRDAEDDLPDSGARRRLFNAITLSTRPVPSVRSQPVLLPGKLIWAAPFCSKAQCIDTGSGEIVWSVPRTVQQSGELEGSSDHYSIAAGNDNVVMLGPRHIRLLDATTGAEKWIAPISMQSGRAFCSRDACLVPLLEGSLASFDLKTGKRAITSAIAAAVSQSDLVVSVVADEDVVCIGSPVGMTVLPTARAYRRNLEQLDLQLAPSVASGIDLARTFLLDGDFDNGIRLLEQIHNQSPNGDSVHSASNLLAETLLSLIAERIDEGRPDAGSVVEMSEKLAALPLSYEQKIRHAALLPSIELDDLRTKVDSQLPTIHLRDNWTARADIVAWNSLSASSASRMSKFKSEECLTLPEVEHAILQPSHVEASLQWDEYAALLIQNKQHAAAELYLLSAMSALEEPERSSAKQQITELRAMFATAPPDLKTFETPSKWDIKTEEQMTLGNSSQIAETLSVSRRLIETPDWYTQRLLLTNQEIISADMEAGVIIQTTSVPRVVDPVDVVPAFETPSIIPVTTADHLGVFSLLSASGPKLLWWKRIERAASDVSGIEVASLGANYLIARTNNRLTCFHPLTGHELWSRRISADVASLGLFQQVHDVFGDDRVTAVLGNQQKSCEVFSTADGQRLPTVLLDIPRGQTPLTSGRNVLYLKDQRLVLVNLLTGTNLLKDKPAINVLGAGQARLLNNHRALTLTDSLELLVMNLKDGSTEFVTSVAGLVQPTEVVGLVAFERDGRLFVLLKDWNSARSQRSASSKLGEVQLGSGVLCCINSSSGTLLWSRPTDPCVVPLIYGDKCPLIVTWAFQHPQYIWEQRLGRGRNQTDEADIDEQSSLVLTVIDSKSGKTVLEQKNLCRTEPVRCVHVADQKLILLETDRSVIEVTYGE